MYNNVGRRAIVAVLVADGGVVAAELRGALLRTVGHDLIATDVAHRRRLANEHHQALGHLRPPQLMILSVDDEEPTTLNHHQPPSLPNYVSTPSFQ